MKSWQKIELGHDATKYLQECLSSGRTLSTLLLQRHNLARGKIFTFIPGYVDTSTAKNVKRGLLLPEPSPDTHVRYRSEDGSTSTMVPVPNTDSIMVEIILDFMKAEKSRVCVFEESMAKPSDLCMKTVKKTKWHAFDNEIYYYLKWQDAKLNKISQALKDAASIHPGLIGVMASLPEMQSFALSRKMSLNTLKQLADNTDRIIVGAYDGEGYLVWYEPTKVALEEKEVGNP